MFPTDVNIPHRQAAYLYLAFHFFDNIFLSQQRISDGAELLVSQQQAKARGCLAKL